MVLMLFPVVFPAWGGLFVLWGFGVFFWVGWFGVFFGPD